MKSSRFLALLLCLTTSTAQAGPHEFLTGEWEMVSETSESLGNFGLVLRDGRVLGNGTLMESVLAGRRLAVRMQSVNITDDGVHLQVMFDEGGSGLKRVTPLLLTLPKRPGGPMRGSLREGERFALVTLRYVAAYQGGLAPPDEQAQAASRSGPVQGATSYSYDLVGVPAGKRITLRAKPSGESTRVGALPADKRGLLMERCSPAIDGNHFDSVSHADRVALLAERWCEVRDVEGHQQGFIKGRYLTPVVN
ncbi:hypothetical protein [Ahrensia sp. R2A130]|uniref:hypothetical protein n=1 Tax=Ahrensia sp. R2A130 TaxID=744979 RepID=UPI0001E09CCA|nr:hypothetical protein [Ahrensia sp. R2A130]EFL88226.1 conserved hypothetical protein [Ahrensia sp. R2A130]